MTTVILGPPPAEVEALIAQRQRLGLDGHDEVWGGVYHMAPNAHSRHGRLESELQFVLRPLVKARGWTLTTAFNLGGSPTSFRVPDIGVFAEPPDAMYVPTALIVGEVLSPDDETFAKIPYYQAHGVQELFVVDPATRTIEVHRLQGTVRVVAESALLGVATAKLAEQIEWP
jgi:Uma2 family endonuclease